MVFFIILLCLGFLLLLFMLKEAFSNRVLYHELPFHEFPESFGELTVFFISDIHRREISERIIIEASGKADLVVVGGDLTEKGVPVQRVKDNLLKLKEIAPVFFVWGNNDYEAKAQHLSALLLECGAKIIANTAVKFESDEGDFFTLMGIDDLGTERDRLDYALLDAKKEGFRVLVSHNPAIMDKIKPEDHVHLVISGHTHGGQIRLFGMGLHEKGGIKKAGKTVLLVSNGYGTTLLPLRLGAKSETHLITIKHQNIDHN